MAIGNGVTFIGRLTSDIELRKAGDLSVCNFTLARNRPNKKDGEDAGSDFVDCVAWRRTAELLSERFSKGDLIGISGSLYTSTYQKDVNGTPINVKRTEIVVENIDFSFIKKRTDNTEKIKGVPMNDMDDSEDSELPF